MIVALYTQILVAAHTTTVVTAVVTLLEGN